MNKVLIFLLGLLLLLPVSGELWRLPVMGFELLPSDVFIPVFFILWALYKWKNDRVLRIGKIGKTILLFMFVVILTYLLNWLRFPWKEMVIAGTYLGRFFMYIILAFVAYDLLAKDKNRQVITTLLAGMTASMVFISLLGFLQLKFFPSFQALGLDLFGWDPHIGRLLSTWFDPNFVGGYLAFILGVTLALALYARHKGKVRWAWALWAVSFLGLAALYYTFSRSGYLAMVAAIGVLAFFKSRKLLAAMIVLACLGFAVSPRVQQRVGEAWDSARSLFGTESQYALDPTAELRVQSWGYAWEIIKDHPLIGVGYSRYAYETNQRGYKLLSDHDAGGSDSSLLTLWATTGIFGLLSYLSVFFVAAVTAIKNVWRKTDFKSYLSSGLIAAFAGTMVHSLFVNSLLFPLMMVYLWVGLGLLDED